MQFSRTPFTSEASCVACSSLPKDSLGKLRKELAASQPADETTLLCHHLAHVLAHPPEPFAPQAEKTAAVRALEALTCLSEAIIDIPDALLDAAQRCASAMGATLTAVSYPVNSSITASAGF